MKNLYRLFKQQNPTVKTLAQDIEANPTARANACISLAEKAHDEATRLGISGRAGYAEVKRSYYFYKAHSLYARAEVLYKESENEELTNAARKSSKASLKASQVSVQRILL